jgi:hypothetical protein
LLLQAHNFRILVLHHRRCIHTSNHCDQEMQHNGLHPLMHLAASSNTEQIQPAYDQFQGILEFESSLTL